MIGEHYELNLRKKRNFKKMTNIKSEPITKTLDKWQSSIQLFESKAYKLSVDFPDSVGKI
jgi:hypothetical protein